MKDRSANNASPSFATSASCLAPGGSDGRKSLLIESYGQAADYDHKLWRKGQLWVICTHQIAVAAGSDCRGAYLVDTRLSNPQDDRVLKKPSKDNSPPFQAVTFASYCLKVLTVAIFLFVPFSFFH